MTTDRDRTALQVPVWLQRLSSWAKGLLLIGAALGVLLWLALQLRVALVPFLLALIAAAALRPVARRLEEHRFPPPIAAFIPIGAIGAIFGLAGWFVFGRTQATLRDDEVTGEAIRKRIDDWLMAEPFDLSRRQVDDVEESVRSWVSTGISSFGVEQATLAVQLVGGALLTLILTFFLVKDGPGMWNAIVSRIDPVRADAVRRSGESVSHTLAAYLRSVVLTGMADALLIGAGLWVLGVPLVVPLMILTAVAALFPLAGAVVAGAAAAIVALVTIGPTTAFWVVVLTIVVQQVEGNVMQPLIMARQIAIHPVVVLVSLTAGGAVAGLAGAFLAVPIVAAGIAAVQAFSHELDVEYEEPPPDATAT
ncbi:MAG: AI-2E family transporter [Ilumatobacter sp.]|uniref:AI-2E family transporter n=1 Tax=Ilumatobacter sp. TaxID=1967498 RepID=UPI003C71366D